MQMVLEISHNVLGYLAPFMFKLIFSGLLVVCQEVLHDIFK